MEYVYTLGIIGAGQMGSQLARAFVARGALAKEQLIVSDIREEPLTTLAAAGIATTTDNAVLAAQAEALLLAVKPQILPEVCAALPLAPTQLVISIAAGIGLRSLEEWLGPQQPIIRVMPNILAAVGEAASAYTPNAAVTNEQRAFAEKLFGSVGVVVPVEERLMEAVTGLSGSGPAFVAVFAEAMIDGGVAAGLSRAQAAALAAQTIKGVGRWLLEVEMDPARLKNSVTSPGGTTIAGLRALEQGGLRGTVIEAIVAATERARQLGQ